MSQAEDLLNSLSDVEEEVVHEHDIVDSDTYFIIDHITREIDNTARRKNVLMQFDHNSERFTFEVARYVEGHDMSLCNHVFVHYNNIDSKTGTENADLIELEDLRVNPDNEETVICSWLISRNATQLAGILSFLVQYACISEDGDPEYDYEWHSDIYSDIEIKAGRDNTEQAISEYSDILEQWREKLFGAGDSVEANIAATGEAQVAAVNAAGEEQVQNIDGRVETVINNYIDENGIQIPSDEHINELIDIALGEVENGSY